MLRFIISFILFINFWTLSAQNDSLSVKTDTILPHKPVKIRFGFDIGKFVWAQLQDSKAYDFYVDANFYKDYYLILSYGTENHYDNNNLLNYNTTGHYYKLGVSYNLYRNWLDMNNDITIGLHYGYASYDYLLHSYRINQPGAVYTPEPVQINKKFTDNTSQWVELVAQIQVETFKHVFLGYAIQAKYLLHISEIQNFTTIYIPGFFNKNTYSNFGFGMQYFISYQFKF